MGIKSQIDLIEAVMKTSFSEKDRLMLWELIACGNGDLCKGIRQLHADDNKEPPGVDLSEDTTNSNPLCGYQSNKVKSKRISIYIEESVVDYAAAIGGGNISLGFRKLAERNRSEDAIKLAKLEDKLSKCLQLIRKIGN